MKKRLFSVIRQLLIVTASVIGGNILAVRMNEKKYKELQALLKKNVVLCRLFHQWLTMKQEKKSISAYLEKNNFLNVAIYGMGDAGQALKNELAGSRICVRYGIDKRADEIYSDLEIMTLEGELPDVDAVIVTSVYFIYEVERELNKKMSCPVLSLQDILDEL